MSAWIHLFITATIRTTWCVLIWNCHTNVPVLTAHTDK